MAQQRAASRCVASAERFRLLVDSGAAHPLTEHDLEDREGDQAE
jgi:hypothetical protein